MFTADDARRGYQDDLDRRIKQAIREAGSANHAYLRIYIEDSFCHSISEELQTRGFKNIDVPDITLKGARSEVGGAQGLDEPKKAAMSISSGDDGTISYTIPVDRGS